MHRSYCICNDEKLYHDQRFPYQRSINLEWYTRKLAYIIFKNKAECLLLDEANVPKTNFGLSERFFYLWAGDVCCIAKSDPNGLYHHPNSLNDVERKNYCRSYNIYSLGDVLLEIGSWKVLQKYHKPHYFSSKLWRDACTLKENPTSVEVGGLPERVWCTIRCIIYSISTAATKFGSLNYPYSQFSFIQKQGYIPSPYRYSASQPPCLHHLFSISPPRFPMLVQCCSCPDAWEILASIGLER